MNFEISPKLLRELKNLKRGNPELTKKIEKQLSLFQENHKHPSLRIHKLTGNLGNYWSISIDKSIRMLYILENGEAYFFDLGTHDEVYRK